MSSVTRPSQGNAHPAAFSLVELLTVLAIIALLVAMFAPALPRARQSALRVQCASNLRQVGAALIMYDHTYKRLPDLERDRFLFIRSDTTDAPGPEVHAEIVLSGGSAYPEGLVNLKAATHALFACPVHNPNTTADDPGIPSFAPNVFYSGVPFTKGKSTYILAAEVDGPHGVGSHLAHRDSQSPGELAPRRHGLDKSNYLFFDGHVDLLTYKSASGPDLTHWGTDHRKPRPTPTIDPPMPTGG